MRLLSILFIVLFLSASCGKETTSTDLAGTWQLVEITDKSTGSTLTYPAGSMEKIQLSLKADGSFTGNTLKNVIDGGTYTKPSANQLNFGFFNMTKVAEDNLGSAFLTVLLSCGLQSVHPCKASDYTINGKTMIITTALRYDMKMEKR